MKRGHATAKVLRTLKVHESTYYGRKKREASHTEERASCGLKGRPVPGFSSTNTGRKVADEQIKEWMLELLEGEEHVYGYKNLALCLRRQRGLILNKKKAYRICKELGILQKQRKKTSKHPRRVPRNRTVTGVNQLWQIDIKYGYVIGRQRFFFVLSIIDVFDRVVVGQYRGPVCEAKHVVQTLCRALQERLNPGDNLPTIRTDNGPQFVSKLFGDTCESLEIVRERIPPRSPNMNAYIESFHSLLERDLFSLTEFMTFEEAYEALDRYMDFYNNRRMHGSLKSMSPFQFSKWVMTLEDRSKYHRAV
ncbi:IS3 family transposase [Paenibacillus thiaminolyticus]|uniref:IS3 family transposase n=1 Tax=Paenibacillus thiaminolyticus TaxID=49283 RepID=A0A3A3G8C4_PANTH|nr:IS3 family transposase [Paenibacillus thiaminolyticus]RJG14930.1 IS3 family transposase [Paenibacillus thiaminolyticus]